MTDAQSEQKQQKPAVIVGLGEVLWDVFPDGPRFGGAPANFACSAAGLGGESVEVYVASSVGNDDLGSRALQALAEHDVDTSCITTSDQQTGKVDITLDEQGRATYTFAADTAWDRLEWSDDWQTLAERTDAVCFGSLGQRSLQSRATIQHFVAMTRPSALRIFDINLRPPFVNEYVLLESLQLANILKLNDEELPRVAALCNLTGTDRELMQQLGRQFQLDVIALTRGPQGAMLMRGEEVSEEPGVPVQVVDTVGAGDAFTAALAIGLLRGDALETINRTACRVAAFVCSQSGATPHGLAS